jgi:hypothetical protein
MIGFNYIGVFQVGYGASQLEDAVEGSGGKIKLFHGCLEQALS